MSDDLHQEIRRLLNEAGGLPVDANLLDDHADLYLAGLNSHASVDVMLILEEAFEIEFPSRMLNRRTFASISTIASSVAELTSEAA
jgi:acyl carrier protein